MRVWCISNHADLSGRGGMVTAARWNFVNTPIVYCADHPASALLEILMDVDREDLPETYQLLEIDVPGSADIQIPNLPQNWRDDLSVTRQIGTDFVTAGRAAVMQVPSSIVPFAKNYLLSPRVAKWAGVEIISKTVHPFDSRLFT